MDVLVIGIAGGSGSGKSTLTKNIKQKFGDDITVILHDDYYKAHDDLSYDERALLNYDCPDAYDTDLMIEHLKALKSGKSITCPVYDYSIHNRSDKTVEIKPSKVIIIEGILILESQRLCDLIDIKVFVDTDPDIRIIRRIKRDMKKRARSFESIVEQYILTVKPMHEMYVEPSKKNADLVILEGGKNQVALDLLLQKIKNHIQGLS